MLKIGLLVYTGMQQRHK